MQGYFWVMCQMPYKDITSHSRIERLLQHKDYVPFTIISSVPCIVPGIEKALKYVVFFTVRFQLKQCNVSLLPELVLIINYLRNYFSTVLITDYLRNSFSTTFIKFFFHWIGFCLRIASMKIPTQSLMDQSANMIFKGSRLNCYSHLKNQPSGQILLQYLSDYVELEQIRCKAF